MLLNDRFNQWFSGFESSVFPQGYLDFDRDKGGFIWLYMYESSMAIPEDFDVINVEGVIYAVASGIDGKASSHIIQSYIDSKENLVIDDERFYLGNVITTPKGEKALGYQQMDYHVPIKDK